MQYMFEIVKESFNKTGHQNEKLGIKIKKKWLRRNINHLKPGVLVSYLIFFSLKLAYSVHCASSKFSTRLYYIYVSMFVCTLESSKNR